MLRRFLALAALITATLVPAQARAVDPFHIDADTFATGSEFCEKAGHTFDVPAGVTLRVDGGKGSLTSSCLVNLGDGAALDVRGVTLKSFDPAGYLGVVGRGQSRLVIEDALFNVMFVYYNLSVVNEPAKGTVEIYRSQFESRIAHFAMCNDGTIKVVESDFETPPGPGRVVMGIVGSAPGACVSTSFNTKSRLEVVSSEFHTHGNPVSFILEDDEKNPARYGMLFVRRSTFTPGDPYIHHPNPTS